MILDFAISRFRAAKCRVNEDDEYRWWPLYSACLAAFMYSTYFWPWSMDWIDMVGVYSLYPWLVHLEPITWNTGWMLCVVLGVVGLLRSNWVARGLALYGAWMGYFVLGGHQYLLESLRFNFLWYTFDAPARWISQAVGEGTAAAACLWFVYFVVVWIALRPLTKRGYRRVLWLQARILDRWPMMQRFARPVM